MCPKLKSRPNFGLNKACWRKALLLSSEMPKEILCPTGKLDHSVSGLPLKTAYTFSAALRHVLSCVKCQRHTGAF